MKDPFYTGDKCSDLGKWAGILEALGYVVTVLGFRKDQDQALEWCGEQLGIVIQDYAGALRQTVNEVSRTLFETQKALEKVKASVHPERKTEAQESAPEGAAEHE